MGTRVLPIPRITPLITRIKSMQIPPLKRELYRYSTVNAAVGASLIAQRQNGLPNIPMIRAKEMVSARLTETACPATRPAFSLSAAPIKRATSEFTPIPKAPQTPVTPNKTEAAYSTAEASRAPRRMTMAASQIQQKVCRHISRTTGQANIKILRAGPSPCRLNIGLPLLVDNLLHPVLRTGRNILVRLKRKVSFT